MKIRSHIFLLVLLCLAAVSCAPVSTELKSPHNPPANKEKLVRIELKSFGFSEVNILEPYDQPIYRENDTLYVDPGPVCIIFQIKKEGPRVIMRLKGETDEEGRVQGLLDIGPSDYIKDEDDAMVVRFSLEFDAELSHNYDFLAWMGTHITKWKDGDSINPDVFVMAELYDVTESPAADKRKFVTLGKSIPVSEW